MFLIRDFISMNINNQSPASIAEELGERLKQARLNLDMTQATVANLAGVSRKVIINAEKGAVKLDALIAIMMVLDLIDNLNQFLPEQTISPIQLARLQGKTRQRASGIKSTKHEEPPTW